MPSAAPPTSAVVVMLAAVLATSGLFVRVIASVAKAPSVARHRTRVDKPPAHISPRAYWTSAAMNSLVSSGLVVVVALTCGARLFSIAEATVPRIVFEAALILALYDLLYYLTHRFAFHGWSVGRRIHSFHHSIRTPYVFDSLYIHPAETATGVGLFLVSSLLVGPVSLAAFAIAFLVYSLLNLWIHSGIDLPYAALRPLTALVRAHDIHHESMKSGFYASITPLWDVLLGTARRPPEAPRAS